MNRRAFTLLEMLLAVALSAMLMAAVLVVLGGVARDRRVVRSMNASIGHESLVAQLRWDLSNARTMSQSDDGLTLTLVGNGALDRRTLAPTGRLVAVTYRCVAKNEMSVLVREQECLDDPAQPQRWVETLAWNARAISSIPVGADAVPAGVAVPVPPRVRLRLDLGGETIDQELWLK